MRKAILVVLAVMACLVFCSCKNDASFKVRDSEKNFVNQYRLLALANADAQFKSPQAMDANSFSVVEVETNRIKATTSSPTETSISFNPESSRSYKIVINGGVLDGKSFTMFQAPSSGEYHNDLTLAVTFKQKVGETSEITSSIPGSVTWYRVDPNDYSQRTQVGTGTRTYTSTAEDENKILMVRADYGQSFIVTFGQGVVITR